MRRIWKGNAIPSTRKGRIVRSEQRERRTHLPKQMLRPKGAEGCSVSCFGSRKLLNHASIASEHFLFYVLRSLLRVGTLRAQYSKCHSRHFFISPTRGTSELLKKKDCLNFPEKDSFLTEERLHTRKEPHGCAALLHILARACSLFNYSWVLSQFVDNIRR